MTERRQGQGKQSPKFGLEGKPGGQAPPPTQSIPPSTHPFEFLVPNLRMPGMAPWAGATSVLALRPQRHPPPPPMDTGRIALVGKG